MRHAYLLEPDNPSHGQSTALERIQLLQSVEHINLVLTIFLDSKTTTKANFIICLRLMLGAFSLIVPANHILKVNNIKILNVNTYSAKVYMCRWITAHSSVSCASTSHQCTKNKFHTNMLCIYTALLEWTNFYGKGYLLLK